MHYVGYSAVHESMGTINRARQPRRQIANILHSAISARVGCALGKPWNLQGGPKSGHPIYFCYNFSK